ERRRHQARRRAGDEPRARRGHRRPRRRRADRRGCAGRGERAAGRRSGPDHSHASHAVGNSHGGRRDPAALTGPRAEDRAERPNRGGSLMRRPSRVVTAVVLLTVALLAAAFIARPAESQTPKAGGSLKVMHREDTPQGFAVHESATISTVWPSS